MRDMAVISSHDLAPGLSDLIEAAQRSRTYYRRSDTLNGWEADSRDERRCNDSRPFPKEGPAVHGLGLNSVKRLLHITGVRRAPSTRRATKATPVATHP